MRVVLGLFSQTLSTAVVQLFLTEPQAHSHWVKRYTGALCFVKDSNKKSYFCRIYCLMRNELVWEQELYTTIQFHKPRPYLINFEGQDGHVAFNFASEEEADNFFRAAQTMIDTRRRRREERRRRDPPPRPTHAPPPAHNAQGNNHNSSNASEDSTDVVLRNPQSSEFFVFVLFSYILEIFKIIYKRSQLFYEVWNPEAFNQFYLRMPGES